jgi:O-antigen ligase
MLSFGLFLIYNSPGLLLRIQEVFNSFSVKPEGVAYDSTNVRKAILNCDINLIKENYLFGVGFSEIKNALLQCFETNYQSSFYKVDSYFTHNYFIYMFLGSGIFGFILFSVYFFKIVFNFFKLKSFSMIIFILSVFFMLNIEDYFCRQYGLFYYLLIVLMMQKNTFKKSTII